MKLLQELNEAKRANFKGQPYWGKGYDSKEGYITGGGMYSNNWSREDMKKAVDEIQKTSEFKAVVKIMPFNSTAKELANGTLSFKSDQPNMRGGKNKEGGSTVKVYLGGQIRSETSSSFKARSITRIKSPKPHVIAGDPVKSAIETYKLSLKAVVDRYNKILDKKTKDEWGDDPMGAWHGRNE